MRAYLADLIDRLASQEPATSSDESISWAAHREAEKLNDMSMVDELLIALDGERTRARRRACCFVIGKIGSNLQDARCAQVLLDVSRRETDRYVVAAILERVAEMRKPATFDLSRVYDLLDDERWLVRHAAIRALDRSESEEAELRLLRHLGSTQDPSDQTYGHSVLHQIGTARSIPLLEVNARSRKRDVRLSAEAAILAIRSRIRS